MWNDLLPIPMTQPSILYSLLSFLYSCDLAANGLFSMICVNYIMKLLLACVFLILQNTT